LFRPRDVTVLLACAIPLRTFRGGRGRRYGHAVEPSISISTDVAATPATVWSLVTDLPRMDRFSPENVGGRWMDGASGPTLGARFRGTNRNGSLEWWTRVRVVACEPGRLFTFDARTPFGMRVSRWSYVITPTTTGCRLTENWYRVGNWFIRRFMGPRFTGRADRPGYNRTSIEYTLAAVKAAAERQVHGGAES
jgi:Polyketide cyclase / dehydrase and lipid transport